MRKGISIVAGGVVVSAVAVLVVVGHNYLNKEYIPPKPILESFSTSGHGMKLASTKRVMLALHINERGQVFEDSIVRSSGDSLVDSVALGQALQFRFEPAMRGRRPVDVWATFPIKFHGEEGDSACPGLERQKQSQ